jgi:hypothetical protein
VPINGTVVSVPALPAGGYYIDLPPVTGNQPYTTGYHILNVEAGNAANATVRYSRLNASPVAGSTRLEMRGGSETLFATIDYEVANRRLAVRSLSARPHWVSFGEDSLYCRIEIFRGNARLWSKNYYTQHRSAADIYYQDIQNGDQIRIFHREADSRALAVNSLTNEKNESYTFGDHTILTVTPFGIMPNGTSEATQQQIYANNFNTLLNQMMRIIPSDKIEGMHAYNDMKSWLLLGSELLPKKDKAVFANNYGKKFKKNTAEKTPSNRLRLN